METLATVLNDPSSQQQMVVEQALIGDVATDLLVSVKELLAEARR